MLTYIIYKNLIST